MIMKTQAGTPSLSRRQVIGQGIWSLAVTSVAALLAMQFMPAQLVAHPESRPGPLAADPPPQARPVIANSGRALFELTLAVGPETVLADRLRDAGATRADAETAARILRRLVGASIPEGSDLTLSLAALSRPDGRAVERIVLASEFGTVLLSRDRNGLLHAAEGAQFAPRRFSGVAAGQPFWALRAAGLPSSVAREAVDLASRSRSPLVGPFVAVVSERHARFGTGSTPELQYLSFADAQGAQRRLLKWQSEDGVVRWVDPDRLSSLSARSLIRPVAGNITSTFGLRVHPILRFSRMHSGVDFGGSWGSAIRAAADGVVQAAAWNGGHGRQVQLGHRNGIVTRYSHMSQFAVAAGDRVRRGDIIGYVGASGLATGPHLHFEIRRGGQAIDPLNFRLSADGLDAGETAAIRDHAARLLAARAD